MAKNYIKILSLLLFVYISFCNSTVLYSSTTRLEMAFFRYKVVPEILDDFPQKVLIVSNHNTFGGIDPAPGSILRKSFFDSKPCVKIEMDEDLGTRYSTLIVYDADVCCRGRSLLWMWKNNQLGQQTDEQTEYYIPTGCKKAHRIIYLVYQHDQPIDYDLKNFAENGQNATKFNLKQFVKSYNLGTPVQGNILLASFTEEDAFIQAYILVIYVLMIVCLYFAVKWLFTRFVK